jgi:hypothetical protein
VQNLFLTFGVATTSFIWYVCFRLECRKTKRRHLIHVCGFVEQKTRKNQGDYKSAKRNVDFSTFWKFNFFGKLKMIVGKVVLHI